MDNSNALYGNVPNKHEKLFMCGKSGITVARVALQVTHLLSLLYLSSQLVFTLKQVYTRLNTSGQNLQSVD